MKEVKEAMLIMAGMIDALIIYAEEGSERQMLYDELRKLYDKIDSIKTDNP